MEVILREVSPYASTAIYYLASIYLGAAAAVLGPTLQGLPQASSWHPPSQPC